MICFRIIIIFEWGIPENEKGCFFIEICRKGVCKHKTVNEYYEKHMDAWCTFKFEHKKL